MNLEILIVDLKPCMSLAINMYDFRRHLNNSMEIDKYVRSSQVSDKLYFITFSLPKISRQKYIIFFFL